MSDDEDDDWLPTEWREEMEAMTWPFPNVPEGCAWVFSIRDGNPEHWHNEMVFLDPRVAALLPGTFTQVHRSGYLWELELESGAKGYLEGCPIVLDEVKPRFGRHDFQHGLFTHDLPVSVDENMETVYSTVWTCLCGEGFGHTAEVTEAQAKRKYKAHLK